VIKAERAQAETVPSDIVRYYPKSKLPFRGIPVVYAKCEEPCINLPNRKVSQLQRVFFEEL